MPFESRGKIKIMIQKAISKTVQGKVKQESKQYGVGNCLIAPPPHPTPTFMEKYEKKE